MKLYSGLTWDYPRCNDNQLHRCLEYFNVSYSVDNSQTKTNAASLAVLATLVSVFYLPDTMTDGTRGQDSEKAAPGPKCFDKAVPTMIIA